MVWQETHQTCSNLKLLPSIASPFLTSPFPQVAGVNDLRLTNFFPWFELSELEVRLFRGNLQRESKQKVGDQLSPERLLCVSWILFLVSPAAARHHNRISTPVSKLKELGVKAQQTTLTQKAGTCPAFIN